MNALQSILNIVGGAAKQGLDKVPSAVARAKDAYQNFQTDLPANAAYVQSKIAQAVLPTQQLPSYQDFSNNQNQYDNMTNKQQLESYITDDLSLGPTKQNSASMQTRFVAPQNPTMDNLKQQVLSKSNIRPAMQRYLSTIPVTELPIEKDGMWGLASGNNDFYNTNPQEDVSWENQFAQPSSINISPDAIKNGQGGQVLLHELVHQVKRNPKLKDSFIQFTKTVDPKTQPLLYSTALSYYQNGELPPNPEEFYAVLGQNLGSRVLDIPEIKNYYMNVFQVGKPSPFSPLSKPNTQYMIPNK